MIRALKILKNLHFNWPLLCKVYVWPKKKEKLTCGLENDRRNLANFHQNTLKCQNWYLLSWYPFVQRAKCMRWKFIEELCVMNDTEEWWNIWRGIDLFFQNWHKEFDKFCLENLSLRNLHFNGLLLAKVYNVWVTKVQRIYLSWN